MASNLQKRLDKIEKAIQQYVESQNRSGPVYLSEGEQGPEDAIRIKMVWVEASHPLEDAQTSEAGTAENTAPRKQPVTLPPSVETEAEREKRWRKHYQDCCAKDL